MSLFYLVIHTYKYIYSVLDIGKKHIFLKYTLPYQNINKNKSV